MELSVNLEWMQDDKWNRRDKIPFTVHVDDHRILTVATDCIETAKKWLKEAVKTHNNKFGSLLVGVNVERRSDPRKDDNGPNSPYDILELCIGSNCLIYKLLGYRSYRDEDISCFSEFFSASHVIAVGVNMVSVAKNLEKHQGIKIANPTDLNQMAVKGMKREDLDLAKYDVDRLATAVLGQEYWIERPEEEVEWFEGGYYYYYDAEFTEEFVMYGTFESYFVYLIGSKLLEMMNGDCGTGLFKKSKKKKKKRGH